MWTNFIICIIIWWYQRKKPGMTLLGNTKPRKLEFFPFSLALLKPRFLITRNVWKSALCLLQIKFRSIPLIYTKWSRYGFGESVPCLRLELGSVHGVSSCASERGKRPTHCSGQHQVISFSREAKFRETLWESEKWKTLWWVIKL